MHQILLRHKTNDPPAKVDGSFAFQIRRIVRPAP